jgi:hypothetical protein
MSAHRLGHDMAFQLTFQPPQLDSPITTVWDLAMFNVTLQGGILISGRMTFYCYSSAQNIGNSSKILASKSYDLTAAQILAFQQANKLQPGQIAQFAYGLAQSIQDVTVTPAVAAVDAVLDSKGNVVTPAIAAVPATMGSFFANATQS